MKRVGVAQEGRGARYVLSYAAIVGDRPDEGLKAGSTHPGPIRIHTEIPGSTDDARKAKRRGNAKGRAGPDGGRARVARPSRRPLK